MQCSVGVARHDAGHVCQLGHLQPQGQGQALCGVLPAAGVAGLLVTAGRLAAGRIVAVMALWQQLPGDADTCSEHRERCGFSGVLMPCWWCFCQHFAKAACKLMMAQTAAWQRTAMQLLSGSPVRKVLSSTGSSSVTPDVPVAWCGCTPPLSRPTPALPSSCPESQLPSSPSSTGASCCQLCIPASSLSKAATRASWGSPTRAALLAAASTLLGVAASGMLSSGPGPSRGGLLGCPAWLLGEVLVKTTDSPGRCRSCAIIRAAGGKSSSNRQSNPTCWLKQQHTALDCAEVGLIDLRRK